MSSIMKVFLLLAVMVYISEAQLPDQCLCQRVRNTIGLTSNIRDVQIYQATIFCDRVEIVVTNHSGLRYCLNPKLKAAQKLLTAMKQKTSTTAGPTVHTSSTGSANTARM